MPSSSSSDEEPKPKASFYDQKESDRKEQSKKQGNHRSIKPKEEDIPDEPQANKTRKPA